MVSGLEFVILIIRISACSLSIGLSPPKIFRCDAILVISESFCRLHCLVCPLIFVKSEISYTLGLWASLLRLYRSLWSTCMPTRPRRLRRQEVSCAKSQRVSLVRYIRNIANRIPRVVQPWKPAKNHKKPWNLVSWRLMSLFPETTWFSFILATNFKHFWLQI